MKPPLLAILALAVSGCDADSIAEKWVERVTKRCEQETDSFNACVKGARIALQENNNDPWYAR